MNITDLTNIQKRFLALTMCNPIRGYPPHLQVPFFMEPFISKRKEFLKLFDEMPDDVREKAITLFENNQLINIEEVVEK